MQVDSLVQLPLEEWCLLQDAFKADWPRGISGYSVLDTQRKLVEDGLGYGFKVFCPYGDLWSGMVAVNEKDTFYEIIIQCPVTDTGLLEKSLSETKVIDWRRHIIVPFAPNHVIECVKRVAKAVNASIELILPSESFILTQSIPQFQINLPPHITFGLLTPEHIDLVDSTWPHRYPGSESYFQLLIKSGSGFGLFDQRTLISWVFINEAGTLGHMFTLEEHRRKGYAEILLKLISNKFFEEKKDVFAFAVKGNRSACDLYKKVGFGSFGGVAWCYLNK